MDKFTKSNKEHQKVYKTNRSLLLPMNQGVTAEENSAILLDKQIH